MARQVNVHEAKTHLSELLAAVEEGEEVVIARRGKPIAKITSCKPASRRSRIKLGFFEGMGRELDPDWWKAAKDEEIREVYGDEYADTVGAP